jgi:hypothetical protein
MTSALDALLRSREYSSFFTPMVRRRVNVGREVGKRESAKTECTGKARNRQKHTTVIKNNLYICANRGVGNPFVQERHAFFAGHRRVCIGQDESNRFQKSYVRLALHCLCIICATYQRKSCSFLTHFVRQRRCVQVKTVRFVFDHDLKCTQDTCRYTTVEKRVEVQ